MCAFSGHPNTQILTIKTKGTCRFISIWSSGIVTPTRNQGESYVCSHFWSPGLPVLCQSKRTCRSIKDKHDDFNFRYVDIQAEGISKADLEKTVGKPVETVPQIFIDQEHIGGCTEFEAYAKENLGLFDQFLYQALI